MTTRDEARELIFQRLIDGFPYHTVTDSDTQLELENNAFEPTPGQPWLRAVIRHGLSAQQTLGGIGNRKFQRNGSLMVQVFVPENTGGKDASKIAEAITDRFEGIHIGSNDIRFPAAEVREVGVDKDGWFLVVAEAFFDYDERK